MFCIGCAGRLPAFVATGPSALEAMGVAPPAARAPAREERLRTGVTAVAETPALWLTLSLAGLIAMAAAAGWYLWDHRTDAGTLASKGGNLAAAGTARSPVSAMPASTATRSTAAAATSSAPDPIPSPQEWLDKAEELVDSVVPRLTGTLPSSSPSTPAPLTPLVPAPLARNDIGPDAPARVVAAFYGALAAGDGEAAAAVVTPAKRDVGRFSKERMTRFYGSFSEPLSIRSIRQIDAHAVEARYTYRATRTACEGVALVHTERVADQTVIRSIRANC
jgi:hypothetical protein